MECERTQAQDALQELERAQLSQLTSSSMPRWAVPAIITALVAGALMSSLDLAWARAAGLAATLAAMLCLATILYRKHGVNWLWALPGSVALASTFLPRSNAAFAVTTIALVAVAVHMRYRTRLAREVAPRSVRASHAAVVGIMLVAVLLSTILYIALPRPTNHIAFGLTQALGVGVAVVAHRRGIDAARRTMAQMDTERTG